MKNFPKSLSLNLASLLGWISMILQWSDICFIVNSFFEKERDISADGIMQFVIFIFLVAVIVITVSSLLIEYILKKTRFNLAFNFPADKIKYKIIYLILFWLGIMFIFVPVILSLFM